MYCSKQVPILQKIIMLRDLNFSVAQIAEVLENWSDDFIIEQLQSKKEQSKTIIALEQDRIAKIEIAMKDIKKKNIDINYSVSIKEVPSYNILSLRRIIPNYNCERVLWEELFEFVERESIDLLKRSDNNLSIYHDIEHKESEVDVEVGIVVNELGQSKEGFVYRQTEKVDLMACIMVYGPYSNIAGAYKSLIYWLEEHKQYKMYGMSRQICHKGEHDEQDPDLFLTEIQIPIIKIE
jgi:effector-binding domain-containing protein